MPSARVGTSGFSYAHWRDVLYPKGLPQRKWLAHYATVFDTVELNVTFYRAPAPHIFERWRDETPPHFRFTLKAPRWFTERRGFEGAAEEVPAFMDKAALLGEKLDCILWQLPPGQERDDRKLREFLTAATARTEARHALEFRHLTWYTDEVYDALSAANVALVVPDWPIEVLLPGDARHAPRRKMAEGRLTADFAYLRRHGPGKRYQSGYKDEMVQDDARWVAARAAEGRDVLVYYNNDRGGHAVRDAQRLGELVATGGRRASAPRRSA